MKVNLAPPEEDMASKRNSIINPQNNAAYAAFEDEKRKSLEAEVMELKVSYMESFDYSSRKDYTDAILEKRGGEFSNEDIEFLVKHGDFSECFFLIEKKETTLLQLAIISEIIANDDSIDEQARIEKLSVITNGFFRHESKTRKSALVRWNSEEKRRIADAVVRGFSAYSSKTRQVRMIRVIYDLRGEKLTQSDICAFARCAMSLADKLLRDKLLADSPIKRGYYESLREKFSMGDEFDTYGACYDTTSIENYLPAKKLMVILPEIT